MPCFPITSTTARSRCSLWHAAAPPHGCHPLSGGRVRAPTFTPHHPAHTQVDYFGAPTPLKQMASISVPDSTTLQIMPFDASTIKDIERAINVSGGGGLGREAQTHPLEQQACIAGTTSCCGHVEGSGLRVPCAARQASSCCDAGAPGHWRLCKFQQLGIMPCMHSLHSTQKQRRCHCSCTSLPLLHATSCIHTHAPACPTLRRSLTWASTPTMMERRLDWGCRSLHR